MVSITAAVSRQGNTKATTPKEQQGIAGTEIPVKLLVPGDIVFLSAGDMIPADIRLIVAKDSFLGQSTLTGESLPVEKHVDLTDKQEKNPLELVNLCFMGTTVVSGSGTAVVAETEKDHVLICKGAVEEVLKVCTQLKVDDKILPIDDSVHTRVADLQKLNSDGLRVIAVAYKTIPLEQTHCAIADESDLILLGNIAFSRSI